MKSVFMDYKKITKELLQGLPPRTINVVERRFGLSKDRKETLESIGRDFNITRERIRQIENETAVKIRPVLAQNKKVVDHFNNVFSLFGGIKKEDDLLDYLGDKNNAYFILSNLGVYQRIAESPDFYTCWITDASALENAKKTIKSAINLLTREKRPLALNELLKTQNIDKDIFMSRIQVSKKIGLDYSGRYGLANWIEVNPKGIKDKAYLVIKNEQKPVHFADVARKIEQLPISRSSVHTATVHNELIKDGRFVLVGRGLYALAEWGYEPGIVKDIIAKILKSSNKPLSKEEILKKVGEQRFVKENTIALNLQNRNLFLRNSSGKYTIKES